MQQHLAKEHFEHIVSVLTTLKQVVLADTMLPGETFYETFKGEKNTWSKEDLEVFKNSKGCPSRIVDIRNSINVDKKYNGHITVKALVSWKQPPTDELPTVFPFNTNEDQGVNGMFVIKIISFKEEKVYPDKVLTWLYSDKGVSFEHTEITPTET